MIFWFGFARQTWSTCCEASVFSALYLFACIEWATQEVEISPIFSESEWFTQNPAWCAPLAVTSDKPWRFGWAVRESLFQGIENFLHNRSGVSVRGVNICTHSLMHPVLVCLISGLIIIMVRMRASARVYVCMYVCICICMRVCMHIYIYIYIYCMRVCMYMCICMRVCMHICACATEKTRTPWP